MVDMTENCFFEEDDEYFADAFRSISEIESSLNVIEESNSVEHKSEQYDELLPSTQQNQLRNSCSENINSHNKNSFCDIKNIKGFEENRNVSPLAKDSCLIQDLNGSKNQCFLPGHTPKATKRKFPGPAGIFLEEPPRKLSIEGSDISKNLKSDELEYELIKSSQLSVGELLKTVSWKKLQEDVSSNQGFLSSVKDFNVEQVLRDTSTKRLPKHIVVPILRLYIKKFNAEEPVSIYMDDTGEISGKVDKEVLELYSTYIKTGTSLVLKKITFVCNIMLLEKSNLVSMYLDDGTVYHLQKWDTLIKEELSNSFSCIFPVTPKMERPLRLENTNVTPVRKQTPNRSNESSSQTFLPKIISHPNFSSHSIHFENTDANHHQNMSIDAANSSDPDFEMDNFDELLGNIDEKSFLEDLGTTNFCKGNQE